MFWERTCQHSVNFCRYLLISEKLKAKRQVSFLGPIKPENYTSEEKGKEQ